MVEKGTIYHLAKLAGIMLGRLAIQERALDGPGDLILIAAVLVAGVIGYYEAANSLGSIVAMADGRTALGWQLGVAAGIFAAAIAIASIRAANFLPLVGDIILLCALAVAPLAAISLFVWRGINNRE